MNLDDYKAYLIAFLKEEKDGIKEYEKFISRLKKAGATHEAEIVRSILAEEKYHVQILEQLLKNVGGE